MIKEKLIDEAIDECQVSGISVEAVLSGLQKRNDAIDVIKYLEKKLGRTFELDSLKLSDEKWRKRLGDRIRMMRCGLELTQAELAAKIGVTKAAVTAYELGRSEPNLKNLVRLSRALEVPTDWLLGEAPLPQ